jgi:hypothetical protein
MHKKKDHETLALGEESTKTLSKVLIKGVDSQGSCYEPQNSPKLMICLEYFVYVLLRRW